MIERTKEIEQLSRKYRAIGPLLTKMEGLIAQTNTGKSPKLQKFVCLFLFFFVHLCIEYLIKTLTF